MPKSRFSNDRNVNFGKGIKVVACGQYVGLRNSWLFACVSVWFRGRVLLSSLCYRTSA